MKAEMNVLKDLSANKLYKDAFLNTCSRELADYIAKERLTNIIDNGTQAFYGKFYKSRTKYVEMFTEEKNIYKNKSFSGSPYVHEVQHKHTTADKDYSKMTKLINFLFDNDKQKVKFIENFMAQFFFEYRTADKISLFLTGERLTGKGTFINLLEAGWRTAGVCANYVMDSRFNGSYKNAKIIRFQEAEGTKNSFKEDVADVLIKNIKKDGGSETMEIEKKGVDVEIIDSMKYYIVETNKPEFIRFSDNLDKDEKKNQFMIIKMKSLEEKLEEQGYIFTTDQIAEAIDQLGNYIKFFLLDKYKEITKEYKNYRYGLPTPIFPEMKQARGRGMFFSVKSLLQAFFLAENTSDDEFLLNFKEQIEAREKNDYTTELENDFREFHDCFKKDFIPNSIFQQQYIEIICGVNIKKDKVLKKSTFLKILKAQISYREKDLQGNKNKSINGKTVRGIEISETAKTKIREQLEEIEVDIETEQGKPPF